MQWFEMRHLFVVSPAPRSLLGTCLCCITVMYIHATFNIYNDTKNDNASICL